MTHCFTVKHHTNKVAPLDFLNIHGLTYFRTCINRTTNEELQDCTLFFLLHFIPIGDLIIDSLHKGKQLDFVDIEVQYHSYYITSIQLYIIIKYNRSCMVNCNSLWEYPIHYYTYCLR